MKLGFIRNFFVVFVCLTAQRAFADWIPITVVVDGIKIGDINTEINKKSAAVSVKGSELIDLLESYVEIDKVRRLKSLIATDESLSLENLSRVGIDSSYSDKELRLTLIIPLEMRVVKDFPVLIKREKAGLLLYSRNYSGYLNLRGSAGYTDQSTPTQYAYNKTPAQAQLELVQNFNIFTFESTANYKEFDQNPMQRNDTSLVHDFENQQIRLRAGDYTTGIQGFQSTMPAGGIQVQKQFNIYPDRGSVNKRSTNIRIKNNSLLEVYVNKILISRIRLNAGLYNLKDLPLLYGRNTVEIVLLDDFGGREEFLIDLLFDDQILAEGVSDFYYQAGRPSYFVGNEKKYSEDNFSSFYHKYGYSDVMTFFLNHQNFQSANLFGIGVGWLTEYGTHFLDLARYSDGTVSSDGAARWRYNSPELSQWGLNRFRFFGGAEIRTKDFNTITLLGPTINNLAERYDFVFQKQLTEKSSMSFGVTTTIGQNFGENDLNRRFVYQNQFARNWRFDVSYSWSQQQKDLDQVLLTLNWLEPEGKAQSAFAYDTVDRNSSVRVTKNNKLNYNDLQIDISAAKQKSRTTSVESQNVNLYANYYATKYEARLQFTGASQQSQLATTGQLGLGTALAWTLDGVSFARPISDAFAIVEAEGLGDRQYLTIPNGTERDSIKIKNNENFVFSNLTSYLEKSLQLDSTSLGVSSHLDREAYVLNPKYRTGFFVPLKVVKSIMVRGRLISEIKGQAGYIYGKILDSEGKIFSNDFFTDEYGNFIIDGLSYGKYQIVLSGRRLKAINFSIEEVPEEDHEEGSEAIQGADQSDLLEFELGSLKVEKEAGK